MNKLIYVFGLITILGTLFVVQDSIGKLNRALAPKSTILVKR